MYCIKKKKINMNALSIFVSLIITNAMSTVRSQKSASSVVSSSSGLGGSACAWFGTQTDSCSDGKVVPVPCEKMPQNCSAFVWESITVTWSNDVYNSFISKKEKEYLNSLIKCGKPVYAKFGMTYAEWTVFLLCNSNDEMNAKDQMEGLKAYFNEHPGIAGLIIRNLVMEEGEKTVPDLTSNFIKYVEILKETFPKLDVGLHFDAKLFIDYYDHPNGEWLDFNALDCCINFYVFSFEYFNMDCTDKLRNGMTPIKYGEAEYTMEKLQAYIKKAGIPQQKSYFKFDLIPQTRDADTDSIYCDINYQQMCLNPKESCNWCSDNLQTLYEKGVYTKQHANGFIGHYVDLDDFTGLCKCGENFPAFNALLRGYNSERPPAPCTLFDRT